MVRHGRKSHCLEGFSQGLRIGAGELDKCKTVGPKRIVKYSLCHSSPHCEEMTGGRPPSPCDSYICYYSPQEGRSASLAKIVPERMGDFRDFLAVQCLMRVGVLVVAAVFVV